jgi:hypothetical protein
MGIDNVAIGEMLGLYGFDTPLLCNTLKPGRRSAAKLLTKDEASRIAVNIACIPVGARKQRSCRISNATMCMNKGCLGVALGSDGGPTMHDIDRLRKEANRLRAAAQEAKAHGKSQHANRLQVRAQYCLNDATVLDMVEMRLRAEQAKPRH